MDILDAVESFRDVLSHVPLPASKSEFTHVHQELCADKTAIVLNGQYFCGEDGISEMMANMSECFLAFSQNQMGRLEAADLTESVLCNSSRACGASDALFALYRLFAPEGNKLLIKPRPGE
jgi:hypothetical protein